jgi:hypothetical protein
MAAREVLAELSKVARANMLDYMKVGPHGDPVLDFSGLTHGEAAALIEVHGQNAREVRRVRFKLASKSMPSSCSAGTTSSTRTASNMSMAASGWPTAWRQRWRGCAVRNEAKITIKSDRVAIPVEGNARASALERDEATPSSRPISDASGCG